MECQIHQCLISTKIRANNADIPIAAAGSDQLPNLFCRSQTLLIGRFRPQNLQTVAAAGNWALKQCLPQRSKRSLGLIDPYDLHFLTCPPCQLIDLRCRIARLFKGQQFGSGTVAVHGDGHIRCVLDQIFQNRHMLTGKVRESVYVKYMIFRKIALLHLLQKQGFLFTGIPLAMAAHAVIGLQNQRQLMELLRQRAFRIAGGIFQILRRNAAALEFVHRIDHAA